MFLRENRCIICSEWDGNVTVAVRASLTRKSWDVLQKLEDCDKCLSWTVWSGPEGVSAGDISWMKENMSELRVFYDLNE